MRRVLLILILILALLVSCATGKTPVAEPEVETVVPTVVEEPTQVVEPSEEAAEIEAPEEEEVPAEEVEVIPEEEQIVVEEQVAKEEAPVEEPAEEEIPAEAEQDWSQVITAAAPGQEAEAQPAEAEEAPVVEAAPVEEEKPSAAAEPEKPQTKAAKKDSFVDKLTALIKKAGNFIVKEKLLSAGIFVCFIGIIYIIVALIISARRERREDAYFERKPEYDSEIQETVKPKQDTDPESEDDEFLRSLLGDS